MKNVDCFIHRWLVFHSILVKKLMFGLYADIYGIFLLQITGPSVLLNSTWRISEQINSIETIFSLPSSNITYFLRIAIHDKYSCWKYGSRGYSWCFLVILIFTAIRDRCSIQGKILFCSSCQLGKSKYIDLHFKLEIPWQIFPLLSFSKEGKRKRGIDNWKKSW